MNTVFIKIAVGILVVSGGIFLAASYFVDQREQEVVSSITIEILEQEKALSTIAEITDRDGADAVVADIIVDCTPANRARFDDLLNRLGTLGRAELAESEQLFDACARFFSQRKAVMVARMEREYEVFEGLVDVLRIVDDSITVAEFRVDDWRSLVDLEKSRSSVFAKQADIQFQIIKALQDGLGVGSEEIQNYLAAAQNVNEEAVVLDRQIDVLRLDLLDV